MVMNTFTGTNGGIGYQDGAGATGVLTNNTFTGVQTALNAQANSLIVFQNNTVTSCITQPSPSFTGAIQIGVTGAVAGGNITITGNQITNNAGYSMKIQGLPGHCCSTSSSWSRLGNQRQHV